MAYWWVNHKQTFRQEFQGGYIWSPQKNSNGSVNQTYTNLKLAKIGDVVFSYSQAKIKAIGVVEREWDLVPMPPDFGSFSANWARGLGFRVRVDWLLLRNAISPKDYIGRIAPLLPEKLSPIQKNGNGNQGCYLASLSDSLGGLLMLLIEQGNQAISSLIDQMKDAIKNEIEALSVSASDKPELEKVQIIKARTGQGLYRQNLLGIEEKCRVTLVDDPRVLIASHIKPWRVSDNKEKLDGNNGLLLSPHVDCLFDKALITFSKAGYIQFVDSSSKSIASRWGIHETNIGKLNKSQQEYMEYHRDLLFDQNRKLFDAN